MTEATKSEPRVFSEQEHLAILADRIATETADATQTIEQQEEKIADLTTRLDAAETARLAAETARDEAVAKHEEFVAQVEEERERAARKGERIEKVKEVASHLTDDFFTDDRVTRIVAMSDEQFTGYLADIGDAAKVPPTGSGGPPRETAGIQGSPVDPPKANGGPASAAHAFLLRNYVPVKEG